jgi:hypothetical protein
MIVSLLSL